MGVSKTTSVIKQEIVLPLSMATSSVGCVLIIQIIQLSLSANNQGSKRRLDFSFGKTFNLHFALIFRSLKTNNDTLNEAGIMTILDDIG